MDLGGDYLQSPKVSILIAIIIVIMTVIFFVQVDLKEHFEYFIYHDNDFTYIPLCKHFYLISIY